MRLTVFSSESRRRTVPCPADIQEHLGTVAAKAYQLGMGLQDSAAIAGLTIINPALGKMGTMLLGGASATQTMLDAVERGASDEQAIGLGLLSGALEIFFEKYELDELLDNVKIAVKGAGKGALVKTMARQALSEGTGEGATEIANILADCVIMAEKSNWQLNIDKYMTEKNMSLKEAKKQAFIDVALQVGEAVVGGLISGSVSSSAYTGVQTLVKNSLKGKGIPAQKIDTLAEAIVARVDGQELTRLQSDVLRSELDRSAVQNVINDLIQKKSKGIDSAQNDGYDKIGGNENRYETVTEDAAPHQERNMTSEGPDEDGTATKKPYSTSRPNYGKGQIEQVWENAKDPVTGKVYDPSGAEITWDPSKPRNGQWDMGHIPGQKYSEQHQLYMDGMISKEEFLEWYRNPAHYRPELPSTNRSHKYE